MVQVYREGQQLPFFGFRNDSFTTELHSRLHAIFLPVLKQEFESV